MPNRPGELRSIVKAPSYVRLCEAYVDRLGRIDEDSMSNEVMNPPIMEDEVVCRDWKAPHYSLLTMFSSSFIADVGHSLGLRYKHNCHQYLPKTSNVNFNSDNFPQFFGNPEYFDFTSIQSIIAENLLQSPINFNMQELEQLCRGCIAEHQSSQGLKNEGSSRSGTVHHCLLSPGGNTTQTLRDKPLPLSVATPSVINRLQHAAEDWLFRTDPIDFESASGVVVYIDESSSFLHYTVYDRVIPSDATSVQILLSSSCAISYIQGSSDCVEHGRRLKRHLIQTRTFSSIGTYVRIDVVASSAAAYARMITANVLVCPPGTVNCLLPALAKTGAMSGVPVITEDEEAKWGSAVVAEDKSRVMTSGWFQSLGVEKRDSFTYNWGYDHLSGLEHYVTVLENVNVTLPLNVIGESEENDNNDVDQKSDIPKDSTPRDIQTPVILQTEEKEDALVTELLEKGEIPFPGNSDYKITTPIRNFAKHEHKDLFSRLQSMDFEKVNKMRH